MAAVAVLITVGLAAVLLLTASRKVIDPLPLSATFQRLGFPAGLALPSARLVPIAEVIAAVLLTCGVGRWFGAAAGALVGIAMMAAGVRGLRSSFPIPCACFSGQSTHPLGLRQVVLGAVYALAGSIAWLAATPLPPRASATLLAITALAVSMVNAAAAWPSIRVSRHGRIAKS